MPQKVRRVDFSPSEWLEGTEELSDEDRGVYITICALIWARGSRIEYEVLRRHSLSHGNKLLASLGRLEKARKIVRKGSEIGQKRAENELKNSQKRMRSARENARQRWKTNALPDAPALPSHMRPLSDGNAITNHQPSKKETPKPPRGGGFVNGKHRANGVNPRANGSNPRASQWAHLDGKDDLELGRMLNIRPMLPDAERREIKRRLGYYVPPD